MEAIALVGHPSEEIFVFINKFKKKSLFLIFFGLFFSSTLSWAIPVVYRCCDTCNNDEITCYDLVGSYGNCAASCSSWRASAVYSGSSSCLDPVACSASTGTGTGTTTATATVTATPFGTATPLPTFSPIGVGTVTAIGFFTPTPTPTPTPLPCTEEGKYRPSGTGACECPPNYHEQEISAGVKACRPNLPVFKGRANSDFFASADPISNYYPVCGSKRIAVAPNGAPWNVSSNSRPNSTSMVANPTGSGPWPYAKANTTLASPDTVPEYLYSEGSWCACTFKDFETTVSGPPTAVETTRKIPPATFAAISGVTSRNEVTTSPVAIGHDSTGTIDPRPGDQFAGSSPKSQCGCADLNAEMAPVDPTNPNVPQGAYCRSMIPDTDPHRVLVEFNPAIHDGPGNSQVVKRNEQPMLSNVITTRIALPVKTNEAATKPYTRRIWACSTGFEVDVNAVPPVCVFNPSKHMCSASVTGSLASAVPKGISGSTLDQQFNNAMNKKVSCCQAEFTKGYNNEKMDCIDNSKTNYSSFDQLWASSDDTADGGQLNAIVLKNPSGAIISGFYRLNGSRCNGKSEFGGTLQPAIVNPARSITGQINKVAAGMNFAGSPLPLPSGSGGPAYTSLQSLGSVPTTIEERLECPILVRAAVKVECDLNNPPLPAKQTTYVQPGSGGGMSSAASKTRCTAAKNIYIHTQVRQLTEIAGMRPLKTFDTVQKPEAAANISIKNILEQQNAGECGAGMKRVGGACLYQ